MSLTSFSTKQTDQDELSQEQLELVRKILNSGYQEIEKTASSPKEAEKGSYQHFLLHMAEFSRWRESVKWEPSVKPIGFEKDGSDRKDVDEEEDTPHSTPEIDLLLM